MDQTAEVRKLRYTDVWLFRHLLRVFKEVFEMNQFEIPDDSYQQELLKKDHFMVYVCLVNCQVVGGLTAYVLPSCYVKSSEVYIYDLAVKTEYQRKGFGRKLISAIMDDCRQLGFKEVFVQADLVDDHALKFYQATGGTAENVVHFNYPLYLVP